MQDLKTYKAEDKAVEGRSQNYCQEWEKNKPVQWKEHLDQMLQSLSPNIQDSKRKETMFPRLMRL